MKQQKAVTPQLTNQQIADFYSAKALLEKKRLENRDRAMEQKLSKATGGKGIVILNSSK